MLGRPENNSPPAPILLANPRQSNGGSNVRALKAAVEELRHTACVQRWRFRLASGAPSQLRPSFGSDTRQARKEAMLETIGRMWSRPSRSRLGESDNSET